MLSFFNKNPTRGASQPAKSEPIPIKAPASPLHPPAPLAADIRKLGKGMVTTRDIIAPSLVEVDFDNLRINNSFYRTLFVAGYPRYVSANWLHPITSFDHSVFIS